MLLFRWGVGLGDLRYSPSQNMVKREEEWEIDHRGKDKRKEKYCIWEEDDVTPPPFCIKHVLDSAPLLKEYPISNVSCTPTVPL